MEGETLACGTGVSASAMISAVIHGFQSPVRVTVQSGDELGVRFDRKGDTFENVRLTGPATVVFEGRITL